MRHKRNAQTGLFDPQAVDHPVADELERASEWLGAARLPGKSALQSTIGSIRAGIWERINRYLPGAARGSRREIGSASTARRPRRTFSNACLLAGAATLVAVSATSQTLTENADKGRPAETSATSLHQRALEALTVRRSQRGTVRAVFGTMANPVSPEEQRLDPYAAAESFFRHHDEAFGVGEDTAFEPTRARRTSDGNLSVRFTQRYAGLRVLQTGAVVKFGDSATVLYAVYDFDPSVEVDPEPAVGPEEVVHKAAGFLTDVNVLGPPELAIYPAEFDPLLRRDALAWTLRVEGRDSDGGFASLSLVVDAHTGRVLRSDDNVRSIHREIYDASSGGLPGDLLREDNLEEERTGDLEIDGIFEQAADSYNYFDWNFGWESFDGDDQDLVASARFGEDDDVITAFYVRGDNNQVAFSTKMGTKDIFTHEFAHGVIEHTGDMVYLNNPGAANESFADVFGAFHDDANWTLGERSAVGTVRDLANPRSQTCLQGLPCPDHLHDYLCTTSDKGGVHHNSSILNHAAYNFAVSVGRARAGEVYFDALHDCMTPISGLTHTRTCVVQQAGSDAATAQTAFDDVGLAANAREQVCGVCIVQLFIPDEDGVYTVFGDEAYRLRDNVFPESDLGVHYRDVYYDIAGDVVDVLVADPVLFARAAALVGDTLPVLQEITGSSSSSTTLTAGLIGRIRSFLQSVGAADTSVGTAVDAELDRIDWDALAGRSYRDAWDHLVDNVSL